MHEGQSLLQSYFLYPASMQLGIFVVIDSNENHITYVMLQGLHIFLPLNLLDGSISILVVL